MEPRPALRFETGDRRGETIPIPSGGLTVGRKPGHSLQILDASVSGRHAEVVLDADGALVRDLGSTNGTRVRDERVTEARLSDGDVVVFGSVRMRFLASAGGLTVGRRTGSTLQILDPSVSGRHAEITVDERGPLLRDLGSTNGTRVRG